MNYVPINGLRMLAVETIVLLVFTPLAYLFLRLRLIRSRRPQWLDVLLAENWRSVVLVIALALVGRALLLPWVGIPEPHINDEYSYLLMGDTFAHGRLTNPTPPSWQHFETFHVNFTPTYHSKYAVAQGIALAFGQILFKQPWIGIYLSTALLCGGICWALQAFLPPAWALLGGLLVVFRIALFSYWMNSYWGGSLPALGGALALGAVARMFTPQLQERNRLILALLFSTGLLLLANSRPYEGLAFSIPLLIYFVWKVTVCLSRQEVSFRCTLLPVACAGIVGLGLMGYYNNRTTGNPLMLPHLLNERTYSPLPLFLWQNPKPAMVFRDPVFAKFYEVTEKDYQYQNTKSPAVIISIEGDRIFMNWFFYCGIALSLPALLGLLSSIMQPNTRLAVWASLSTLIGISLTTYTLLHYAAPATVTLYLFIVEGLRYLWKQSLASKSFVIAVIATVFVTCVTRQTGSAANLFQSPFPNIRDSAIAQIEKEPGKHLVVVSYDLDRHYPGNELVHNWADIESQKILWTRSKGVSRDVDLCEAFGGRTFWSLTTDDFSFSLHRIDLCKDQKPGSPGQPKGA